MFVPYFSFTVAMGKLSKVHMPSSARAGAAGNDRTAVAAPSAASEADKWIERSDIWRRSPGEEPDAPAVIS